MNQIDLDGQHAVVTGGAQGSASPSPSASPPPARTVTLWDMDAAQLENAKAALGGSTRTVAVDVTDAEAVVAAHKPRARPTSGPVSILRQFGGYRRPQRLARRI